MCVCMYIHMYVCVCMPVHMYIRMYVHTCIYIYVGTFTYNVTCLLCYTTAKAYLSVSGWKAFHQDDNTSHWLFFA